MNEMLFRFTWRSFETETLVSIGWKRVCVITKNIGRIQSLSPSLPAWFIHSFLLHHLQHSITLSFYLRHGEFSGSSFVLTARYGLEFSYVVWKNYDHGGAMAFIITHRSDRWRRRVVVCLRVETKGKLSNLSFGLDRLKMKPGHWSKEREGKRNEG